MTASPAPVLLKDHTAGGLHRPLAGLGASPRLARRPPAAVRLGFRRNLAAWEIVDQVLQVRADSPHPVRGVVFMGMGEPLLNYDRVMRAARILSEPCGPAIAARAITVSTVGVVPMIRRFTAERRPYRLVVSLTSADPARRRELLPIEGRHPLPELVE